MEEQKAWYGVSKKPTVILESLTLTILLQSVCNGCRRLVRSDSHRDCCCIVSRLLPEPSLSHRNERLTSRSGLVSLASPSLRTPLSHLDRHLHYIRTDLLSPPRCTYAHLRHLKLLDLAPVPWVILLARIVGPGRYSDHPRVLVVSMHILYCYVYTENIY